MILLLALGCAFYLFVVGILGGLFYPRVRKNHVRWKHCHLSRSKWCTEDHYLMDQYGCIKCQERQRFCGVCIWIAVLPGIFAPLTLPAFIACLPVYLGFRLTKHWPMVSGLSRHDRRIAANAARIKELEKQLEVGEP